LASSTYAIAGTLEALAKRLEEKHPEPEPPTEVLEDFEPSEELAEEWSDDSDFFNGSASGTAVAAPPAAAAVTVTPAATIALTDVQTEMRDLQGYGRLATSITTNAKGLALLKALGQGFTKMAELGAARKAVVFTESRRTQSYLLDVLQQSGYAGRAMTING